jgi:hypothetical protein
MSTNGYNNIFAINNSLTVPTTSNTESTMSTNGYNNMTITEKPSTLSGKFGTVTRLNNGSYKKKYKKKERRNESLKRSKNAIRIMYNGKSPYTINKNTENNSAIRMPYLGIDVIKIIGNYKDYKEKSDIFLKSITVEKLVDESIRLFGQLKRLQDAQLIHGDIRPVNILMNELAFSSDVDLFNIIDFDLLNTVSSYEEFLDTNGKIESTLYPYGLMHFFKDKHNKSNTFYLNTLEHYLNVSEMKSRFNPERASIGYFGQSELDLTNNPFEQKIRPVFILADINQLTYINESHKDLLLKYIDTFSLSISLLMLIHYIYTNRDSTVEDEIGRRDADNQITNTIALLKTQINDTNEQKKRDEYLNTIVDTSESFTTKNARHSLTQLLSNIVFSIHMSEIHKNNLDNILSKLHTIKGTLQSENAKQKSDSSGPKNAYWIGGHSTQLLSSFTVPPGCTIVLKTQIGIQALSHQVIKYYKKIIDVKSNNPNYYDLFTHPEKNQKQIFKLFDNIAIYKAGQRCPDMLIPFSSTYSSATPIFYSEDSGVINFHNIKKAINFKEYSSFTFDDIKNKYAIVKLIKNIFNTSEYPNLTSMTFIEIIKYLFDCCRLIIIDNRDELEDIDKLQEHYKVIITSDISNNPNSIKKVLSDLGAYLEYIRCTLGYLCNIRPGTYYNFLCRSLIGVEQNNFPMQELFKTENYISYIPTYPANHFFQNKEKKTFRKNLIHSENSEKSEIPKKTSSIVRKIYNQRQQKFSNTIQHLILAQEKRISESMAHRKPYVRNVFAHSSNETRRNNALRRAKLASIRTQKKLIKLKKANNRSVVTRSAVRRRNNVLRRAKLASIRSQTKLNILKKLKKLKNRSVVRRSAIGRSAVRRSAVRRSAVRRSAVRHRNNTLRRAQLVSIRTQTKLNTLKKAKKAKNHSIVRHRNNALLRAQLASIRSHTKLNELQKAKNRSVVTRSSKNEKRRQAVHSTTKSINTN